MEKLQKLKKMNVKNLIFFDWLVLNVSNLSTNSRRRLAAPPSHRSDHNNIAERTQNTTQTHVDFPEVFLFTACTGRI